MTLLYSHNILPRFTLYLNFFSLLPLIVAQSVTSTIDPTTVPATTQPQWCNDQEETCSQLCSSTESNTCSSTTLLYSCVCDDGSTPDLMAYDNTIPTHACAENYARCIAAYNSVLCNYAQSSSGCKADAPPSVDGSISSGISSSSSNTATTAPISQTEIASVHTSMSTSISTAQSTRTYTPNRRHSSLPDTTSKLQRTQHRRQSRGCSWCYTGYCTVSRRGFPRRQTSTESKTESGQTVRKYDHPIRSHRDESEQNTRGAGA